MIENPEQKVKESDPSLQVIDASNLCRLTVFKFNEVKLNSPKEVLPQIQV